MTALAALCALACVERDNPCLDPSPPSKCVPLDELGDEDTSSDTGEGSSGSTDGFSGESCSLEAPEEVCGEDGKCVVLSDGRQRCVISTASQVTGEACNTMRIDGQLADTCSTQHVCVEHEGDGVDGEGYCKPLCLDDVDCGDGGECGKNSVCRYECNPLVVGSCGDREFQGCRWVYDDELFDCQPVRPGADGSPPSEGDSCDEQLLSDKPGGCPHLTMCVADGGSSRCASFCTSSGDCSGGQSCESFLQKFPNADLLLPGLGFCL